jgi:hypothetical protein
MDRFTKASISLCIVILFALCAGLWYTAVNNSKENEEPADAVVIRASWQGETPDEQAPPQVPHFDTTSLDSWCGEPTGQIRMIGGWYHAENAIETEDGHLWDLNTEGINEYEFLLVWFDTLNTPEIEDDKIVKVWTELYD